VEANVEAYARRAGFADLDLFQRAVLREYCYCRARTIELDSSEALPGQDRAPAGVPRTRRSASDTEVRGYGKKKG
jgi:hypothetical protein